MPESEGVWKFQVTPAGSITAPHLPVNETGCGNPSCSLCVWMEGLLLVG